MPGFVIHIAIGQEYLRKHNLNYSKEFIKGTVAPDFTDDKSKTHFGKSPRYTNLKRFLDNNKTDNDYNKGFFLHLITDYLFYNYYVTKIGKEGLYNDYDLTNKDIINKYNVILLDNVKDKVFFKEGIPKTLTLELACKIIDEISSMDLKDIEAEVKNNIPKWNYYKNEEKLKIKDEYIRKFYNEVSKELGENYKIILEPNRNLKEDWIEYDKVKWEVEEPVQKLVNKLLKDNNLSFEEKVLEIYKFICLNYVYDANVLYFFRKDITDLNNVKYIAVDWYGRIVGKDWIENRKKHNRRICYEFARFYAKAINELLDGNDNLEAVMVGDKENLHYVVGLTGDDYSIILDLDDFNNIKDLTRLKLGLTIKGINILSDNSGKFQKTLDEFNKGKLDNLTEVEEVKKELRGKDTIKYFNSIINILEPFKLDPQGFFEYMRAIIEEEGIEIEKIWKEVKGEGEKRYARCLIFNFNSKDYLLDSVDETLTLINKEKLDEKLFVFKPEENEYRYFGG